MEIIGLFAGKPQPFGPRGKPSSIIKSPHQQLTIDFEGALEDEQGNKKLHGGPQMALHQYALQSYDVLRQAFPNLAQQLTLGSIGENICAAQMHDSNVYIGDIYQIGELRLQVSSPRAPCAKINQRYGQQKIDLFILEQGITGWYFRVLTPGIMRLGDEISLQHRDAQPVSVKDLMHMTKPPKNVSFTEAQLRHAHSIEALAPEWKNKLARILRSKSSD